MTNRIVGIFDSGIGGLTVLREFLKVYPCGYDVHYVGDTARAPYGSKPPATIVSYAKAILRFLLARQVESVICACNTSDSLLSREEKNSIGVPYFSILDAFASMIEERLPPDSSLSLIATENTVRSGSLLKAIAASEKTRQVMQQACKLFVPIIERGFWHGRLTDSVIRHHLTAVKTFKPDFVVLGCTHYPFLEEGIRRFLGPEVEIIDPGKLVVESFAEANGTVSNSSLTKVSFHVSGDVSHFRERVFRADFMDNTVYTIEQDSFAVDSANRKVAG